MMFLGTFKGLGFLRCMLLNIIFLSFSIYEFINVFYSIFGRHIYTEKKLE